MTNDNHPPGTRWIAEPALAGLLTLYAVGSIAAAVMTWVL